MKDQELLTDSELMRKVQKSEIFNDSKTFVDSIPLREPEKIAEDAPEEITDKFIRENFRLPSEKTLNNTEGLEIEDYIQRTWKNLTRKKKEDEGTFIGLENPFLVPGGRFRETYYWDSYFTVLGLKASNLDESIQDTVENFADLIERYGFIPNGNRTYYLDRSQPPFFGETLKVLEQVKDFKEASKFTEDLEKEYRFWMETEHCIQVEGSDLNRYWSSSEVPRPESFREDSLIGEKSSRESELFRDVRAACESGWDFSTRWIKGEGLEDIHTTDFAAVDLNSILYGMESQLAEWYRLKGREEKAEEFQNRADRRKESFDRFFWSDERNFYFDYDTSTGENSDSWTIAGVFPLYFGLASQKQAEKVADTLKEKFLEDGGLKTTLSEGQQWDSPNGWPPLQYMAVKGLMRYGEEELAEKIRSRWIETCENVFRSEGVMLEKYNVVNPGEDVKDGEYSNQVGFGWTNGVYLALKDL
ncbi:trehalase family glycosidase [Candidatus Nanosalina sp. VS9-1]|uniref:trehalase family glycosidase n=1 Tax=Candidatus Nanosalina sp. VS9-1 TaxID=3388566 RepID=UPI0039DFC99D